jgi:hypothetical protein
MFFCISITYEKNKTKLKTDEISLKESEFLKLILIKPYMNP